MADTMTLNGYTYNVLYVDPSLVSGANNGDSPTDALQQVPAAAALAANTVYLFRRATNWASLVPGTCANANIKFIGMPLAGTDMYNWVPAAAKSAWDADAAQRAVLRTTSTTSATMNGANIGIHHLEVRAFAGSNSSGTFIFNGSGTEIDTCVFGVSGVALSGADATSSGISICPIQLNSKSFSINNSYIYGHNTYAVYGPGSLTNHFENFKVTNTTIYMRRHSSSTGYGIYLNRDCHLAQVKNVSIVMDHNNVSGFGQSYAMYLSSSMNKGLFENIDIKIERATNMNTTSEDYGLYFTGGGFDTSIKNITLTSTFAKGCKGIYCSSIKKLVLDNINISLPNLTNASYALELGSCTGYKASNITVDCGSGTTQTRAFYENFCERGCLSDSVLKASGYAFYGDRSDTINVQMTGAFRGGGDAMHISSLVKNDTVVSPFVDVPQQPAVVYVQTLDVSGKSAPSLRTTGLLLIDQCINGPAGGLIFQNDEAKVYINNEELPNVWHHENGYNRMYSSLVERVSGGGIASFGDQAGYSIRCQGLADSSGYINRAAVLAPRPYSGKEATFGSTGKKRFTLYLAYKLLGSINGTHVWAELEIPDGATGTKTRTISTFNYAQFTSDTSTWENDVSLTTVRLPIEFTLDRNEPIKWRLYYNAYSALGYLYVDPKPRLENLP